MTELRVSTGSNRHSATQTGSNQHSATTKDPLWPNPSGTPIEVKPAPTLGPGADRGPCPACHVVAWWERPDGSAVCGHCVRHVSTHGPNSNGDYRWCPECCDDYWRQMVARALVKLGAA
jgi:hypothetical protein